MRVVIFHNEVSEEAAVDERDVLVQRRAVTAALDWLGHEAMLLGCTLDLARAKRRLTELRPDVVFNLVESLGGTDRLMPLATLLLDAMGLPYTGAPTDVLLATSNKLAAKRRLRAAGLPTPPWVAPSELAVDEFSGTDPLFQPSTLVGPYIVKTVWEHASLGLGDESVVDVEDQAALQESLRQRAGRLNRPCFAERYVEGREFNLSLLAPDRRHGTGDPGQSQAERRGELCCAPQVLPPAEIDFSAYPPGKPRIVGFQAKWDQETFEYLHTPRRFDFPPADRRLLDRLTRLAGRCWDLFGLRGYARVDFRVDQRGKAEILEVNANPCLSPDAGFAAAARRAGIDYQTVVQRILEDAVSQVAEPAV